MKPELKLFFEVKLTSLSPDAMPISLGVVSEDYKTPLAYGGLSDFKSKSFYSEFSDFDLNRCDEWVKENVVSKLRFNNEVWGKNHFEESHTEFGSYRGSGPLSSVKIMLKKWLEQFSNYNIQFVADCGSFDWYWMLQLLAEWEIKDIHPFEKMNGTTGYFHCKTGLPKLPENISPVPQDLNDLIASKKGISVREAFELDREELAIGIHSNSPFVKMMNQGDKPKMNKHNALWDARVIKTIYEKLK